MSQFFRKPLFLWVTSAALVTGLSACGQPDEEAVSTVEPEAAKPAPALQAIADVKISNPSGFERSDAPVYLSMPELGIDANDDLTSLAFFTGDAQVPSQFIDSDGDGDKDQALVLLDLAGEQTADLQLMQGDIPEVASTKRTHAEISIKAGGKWNDRVYEGGVFKDVEAVDPPPQSTDHSEYIRYEGPGIESDKIGYRIYLDWRNGFDIFAKQRHELALDQVGLDGYQSYHELADWGMDVLKVGKAVGVGGFGYWKDGAITRASDVANLKAEVLEDGDLYSAFAIHYDDWNVGGMTTDVDARFSMTAGSHMVNLDLKTDPKLEELAVGIVKLPDTTVITGDLDITGAAWSYMATLGPQALDGSQLAMFVLFQREDYQQVIEDEFNHGVLLKVRGGGLNYYFGSVWEKEPGADLSKDSVEAMLSEEVSKLTYSPRIAMSNAGSDAIKSELGGADSATAWAVRAAEAEIARHGDELAFGNFDTMRQRDSNWEYTMGLLTQSVYQLGKSTGNEEFTQWAKQIVDSYVTDDGNLETFKKSDFNIDRINSGKMLLQLYRDTGEDKYRLAAEKLRDQLEDHPRLDAGAYWHKQRYPYQLWLDGVYMAMPFLAEYTMMFEDGAAIDEIMEEFHVARDNLRDPETGLYYHAWDEKRAQDWADPETGLSHYFWGRGMGWLAMAMVDVYEFLPADAEVQREDLAGMIQQLADALLKYQDANGVWHQIVDLPEKPGNYQEASASTMFTYMLMKGVNIGALPDSYKEAAERSYQALIDQFVLVDADDQLQLTQVCQVGGLGFGRDGSYEYYMSEPVVDNDPKGLGPFIMIGAFSDSKSELSSTF